MFGDRIRASFADAARLGVMRVPGAPMVPSDRSVRMVIQLLDVPLFGSQKLPRYVAPGARSSASPGCAALMAACRSAPAGTRICRAGDGYAVFTVARGSSAGAADP